MRSTFGSRSARPSVDSMMTPMIDVVFLLLIFFLTTSSFQRLEKQLPSASAMPPQPSGQGVTTEIIPPEATDLSEIVIRIQSVGGQVHYKLQEQSIATLEQLSSRLIAILKVRKDVPIIIDPENAIRAGEAIRVYDIVRTNGSVSVFLVAR